MLPNVLAVGRGRSIGSCSPIPHACVARDHRLRAEERGELRKGDVAAAGEHGGQIAATQAPVVVLDRIVGLRRHPFAFVGELAVEGGDAALERDPGGDHLERRSWHVALLVRLGEQRIAGGVLQVGDGLLGDVEVGVDERVRVERRVAVHRSDRAGLRFDHGDRTALATEEELGGPLRVVADCQFDGAGRAGTSGEEVAEATDLLLGGRTGEHVAVHPLDLRRAERERVVAGDVGEQVPGRVLPAILVGLARRGRIRHGRDDAVAGHDRATWFVELAQHLTGVVEAGVEFLLAPDLPVVQRNEQHDVAGDQPERELADLAVHAAARRSSRRRRRPSRHAVQRSDGVGSSGSSPSRLADESERRIRSASRT